MHLELENLKHADKQTGCAVTRVSPQKPLSYLLQITHG